MITDEDKEQDDRVEWDGKLKTDVVENPQKQKRRLKRADEIPHKEAKLERKRRAVTDNQESVPSDKRNNYGCDSDTDADFKPTPFIHRRAETPPKRTKLNETSKTSKYDNYNDKRTKDNDNNSRNSNNTSKFNTSNINNNNSSSSSSSSNSISKSHYSDSSIGSSRTTANNDNNISSRNKSNIYTSKNRSVSSSSQDSVTHGNGFDLNNGRKSENKGLILPERRKKDDRNNYNSNSKSSLLQDSVNHDGDESDVDVDSLQPSSSKLYLPKKTTSKNNNKASSTSSSQDSTSLNSDSDSASSRAKLILPNRRKKEDTTTNNNDDKLEDAERNKIMRRLEKTQQKEKNIVFTCPFCLIPFNHITKAIQKELDLLEKKEEEYKKKAKEEAKQSSFKKPDELIKRPIPTKEKEAFCRLHNHELVIKPTGIKNGYPVDLNFGELKGRIMKLTLELDDVVYKRIPSDYRKVVVEAYDSLGKNKARTPMMLMNRIELLSPGYYGPRGAAIMLDVLSDIYLKSDKLSKQLAHPLMPLEYIQQVLIPETAYRLIRQDIIRKHRAVGTGKPLANANAKAKSIMLESCHFGEAMYPLTEDKEDLIDDRTYQQQLEKERKRKNDYPIVIED